MITAIISLSVLLLISIYINYNLLRKVEKQEDILAGYFNYLDNISKIVEIASIKMNSQSLKTAFNNDDETGFFFKQMSDIQNILNNFIIKEIKEDGRNNKSQK